MVVRTDARARPAIHSHNSIMRKKQTVKRLTRKLGSLRNQLQLIKRSYETDKAEVEEKEREIARRRKWNDLLLTEDARLRQGISITLDITEAQDAGHHVGANSLMPYFRELLSDHIEGRIAHLLSTGREQE